jgi:hypothetical protein
MQDEVVVAMMQMGSISQEVWVNDVPVLRGWLGGHAGQAQQNSIGRCVQEFLRPGVNHLALVDATRDEQRGGAGAAGLPQETTVWLTALTNGSVMRPGEGRRIGRLTSSSDRGVVAGPAESSRLVRGYRVRAELMIADTELPWALTPPWAAAPALQEGSALDQECVELMDNLELAFLSGDRERYARVAGPRLQWLQRAYPDRTPELMERCLNAFMKQFWERPSLIVRRSREDHAFRVVGNGHLVELIDRDRSPSFKYQSESGSIYGETLLAARVDGALRVCA